MRRVLRWAVIIGAIVFVVMQVVRPARTNPPVDPTRALETIVHVPPDVAATLQRACKDCHSYETHWPWYTEFAPGSWLVVSHVNGGRAHMNFSNWNRGPGKEPQDSIDRLRAMCREVQSGSMPLGSYLWIHWRAKLSADDVRRLCEWTEEERSRLATVQTGN
jgi:hypothetical protein